MGPGRAEAKRTAPCRRSGQGPGEGPGLHSKSTGRGSENVLAQCRWRGQDCTASLLGEAQRMF